MRNPSSLEAMSEQEELLKYLPPAQVQTRLAPGVPLNSSNSGVIICRSGQVRNTFRNQARECALEIAEHTNQNQIGYISTFIYEETYGQQDRIYWFIHLRSLSDYLRFHRMATLDPSFGQIFMKNRAPELQGGATWVDMFPEATFQETLLTPHYWGCNATTSSHPVPSRDARLAKHQTTQSEDQLIHSVNARMIVMRSAQLKNEFRSEGREFARAIAENINQKLAGRATCFVYEEHFGPQDRIHWWTHTKTYEDYELVYESLANNDDYRALLRRDWTGGKRDGGWGSLFVDGSITDTLACPQHPTKDF